MTYFCQHRNIGVHSVGGFVECPDCFKLVRHPWYPATVKESLTVQITGIEKMKRLNQEADKLRGRAHSRFLARRRMALVPGRKVSAS